MTILDDNDLARTLGGVALTKDPEQMRALAQKYCPQTAARYRNSPITRPMAEPCLDEAGYGNFKGMLDSYFPRRQ